MDAKQEKLFIEQTLLLGDPHAARFVQAICEVFHLWDDLIDQDRQLSAADIHKAFRLALVEIPAMLFYAQNFSVLHSLIDAVVLNWLAANKLEKSKEKSDLEIAFIVRSSYQDIVLRCAQIVGGFDHAATVAPELRRVIHSEGFDKYMAALKQENRRN
jgi:hypothetical protein